MWTGPVTNFVHAVNGKADEIVPGVAITRGSSGGLYNSVTEHGAISGSSPKDTTWAKGTLTNFANLKYGPCPLEAGNRPPNAVNTTYVVHLVTEDIYFSLTLTAWGGAGDTGQTSFSYARSTPATVVQPPTPTVAITSPADGANFTAPASVNIQATASVSAGTVTNVEFFSNGVAVGAVPVAPFAFTASSLAAGSYQLTAVATAAGVSATSAVVNISVTNAAASPPVVTVAITNPPNGAAFTAPANVTIEAGTTVTNGTVTNVEFFANSIDLGSIQNTPFNFTASNLVAGSYSLTAVASAGGISATSLVVGISVTNAASGQPVNITAPGITGSQFTFNYTTQVGLSYVIESSSNLVLWLPLMTNVGSGGPLQFSDTFNPSGVMYYRVGQSSAP